MSEIEDSCPPGWELQRRPLAWNRRFDFVDYGHTRRFLDLLGELSASTGYYPSLNFTRTHVVITLQFEGDVVDPAVRAFAVSAGECAERAQA